MFGHVCRTRTCGVCAQIALATVPPSSSPAPHPRASLDCGERGCSHPERGRWGGRATAAIAPPPGADLPRGGGGGGNTPIPWRQGLVPRVLSIPGEAGWGRGEAGASPGRADGA